MKTQVVGGLISGLMITACATTQQTSQDQDSARRPAESPAPALIKVNIGGDPTDNSRAWYCKAKAFTDDFEAFAPTQLEAIKAVAARCREKYDPMFCKTSACRLNL
jgi:hypothetical protein